MSKGIMQLARELEKDLADFNSTPMFKILKPLREAMCNECMGDMQCDAEWDNDDLMFFKRYTCLECDISKDIHDKEFDKECFDGMEEDARTAHDLRNS